MDTTPSVSARVDAWLVVLAGADAWRDDPADFDGLARGARITKLVALATVITWPLVAGVHSRDRRLDSTAFVTATVLMLVAFAVLFVPAVEVAVRDGRARLMPTGRPRIVAVIRGTAGWVLVGSWWALVPGTRLVEVWPFGVVVGTDIAETCWTLGMRPAPGRWVRRLALSSVHLGCLVALTAVALIDRDRGVVRVELGVYGSLLLVVLVAALVVRMWAHTAERNRQRVLRREYGISEREHRHLSQWIHDDVCSALRSVRLRVAERVLTHDETLQELDALDHTLRLRQLDEALQGGPVRLAEIIQPFVRLAEQRGVELGDVPALEVASHRVDPATGRLLKRVLSNLVNNAIDAGARELSIRIERQVAHERDVIWVEVRDDAGGFPDVHLPMGRGLDRLRADLGDDVLTIDSTDRGSSVRVLVPAGSPIATKRGAP